MLDSKKKISAQEFDVFLKKGIKKTSKHFRISFIVSKNKDYTKYAVVISKKIAKSAVERNKNKRKIYKIISQIYPQFLDKKYVFIFIQKNILKINENELKEEISLLLKKK